MDRKYCGVGCTQAAYRLRHPEKRGSAAGCAVGALVVPLPIRPQSTALAGSAAKLEAENAALRREQAASKARVAQLNAAAWSNRHSTQKSRDRDQAQGRRACHGRASPRADAAK